MLAEMEAPDLDQQLLQARADLASAQASARLSEVTLGRGAACWPRTAVSQQDVDQRAADLENKQAAVNPARPMSNGCRCSPATRTSRAVRRPGDRARYRRRRADQAGGERRACDVRRLGHHKLRVYVNVPQNYAPAIKIGAKASIDVPEYPEPHVSGDSRGVRAIDRRRFRHDADATDRRQLRRRIDAGRLRQRRMSSLPARRDRRCISRSAR